MSIVTSVVGRWVLNEWTAEARFQSKNHLVIEQDGFEIRTACGRTMNLSRLRSIRNPRRGRACGWCEWKR